jgi:hypothetical protein
MRWIKALTIIVVGFGAVGMLVDSHPIFFAAAVACGLPLVFFGAGVIVGRRREVIQIVKVVEPEKKAHKPHRPNPSAKVMKDFQ